MSGMPDISDINRCTGDELSSDCAEWKVGFSRPEQNGLYVQTNNYLAASLVFGGRRIDAMHAGPSKCLTRLVYKQSL
jgi:hypothetical protein